MDKIKVGAVIYAPKVTVIWEIIAKFFEDEHCPIEPIYYRDYKTQVDGLMSGGIHLWLGWTLFLELKENV